MNLCVAISILKMEENKQHFWYVMPYYCKKGNWNTQKKICAEYGESAGTDQICQKWFAKFHAGDFLLDDAPWSSRPVEVDSNQIETLIENNQHYTMWEIANILKISKSIKLLVKMKNVSFISWEKNIWTFWPTQYYAILYEGLEHLQILVSKAFLEQISLWILRDYRIQEKISWLLALCQPLSSVLRYCTDHIASA